MHLKIGRILGRKLYRKSCSVGNSIIYMVRRDIFWCLCDYCVLVFLCYWESIN